MQDEEHRRYINFGRKKLCLILLLINRGLLLLVQNNLYAYKLKLLLLTVNNIRNGVVFL